MLIVMIRTALLYVMIIAAVRFMGKRQISDLQTTELVVTLLLSDLASMAAQNTSQPLLSGVVPMTVLIVAEVVLSGAMLKSAPLRRLICGRPIIVINDGKVERRELMRLRMSAEDLCEELRQQGIFSVGDVRFAIVETNGRLSVMKKPDKDTPTIGDMKIPADDTVEAVVISDGAVSEAALTLCGSDGAALRKILKREKLDIGDVFIMTLDSTGKYSIVKRSKSE